MKKYLQLLRVKNYVKNILIFLPFVFSGSFLVVSCNYVRMLFGFVIFCLASSLMYIFNDYIDIEKDKLHSKKCNRPLASGAISPITALIFMIVIFICIVGSLFYFDNKITSLWLSLYIVMNLLYSVWLKNIPIVDITILMLFFIVRVYYGASLIGVPVSVYLHLTVMSVAFMMGIDKRYKEKQHNDDCRNSLKYYSSDFLSKISQMFLGLSVVFYSLWIISDTNMFLNKNIMLISIIMVVFILVYYQYLIDISDDGNPVDMLLSHPFLVLATIAYCILMLLGFLIP